MVRVKESIELQKDNKIELPAEKATEIPPRSYEVRKMRLFIEIFDVLSGDKKNDVSEQLFIDELVKTVKFSPNIPFDISMYGNTLRQYS